jgi:hypothetical protein
MMTVAILMMLVLSQKLIEQSSTRALFTFCALPTPLSATHSALPVTVLTVRLFLIASESKQESEGRERSALSLCDLSPTLLSAPSLSSCPLVDLSSCDKLFALLSI